MGDLALLLREVNPAGTAGLVKARERTTVLKVSKALKREERNGSATKLLVGEDCTRLEMLGIWMPKSQIAPVPVTPCTANRSSNRCESHES